MIGLLSYTGMRFEEVLGVRWDDINDDWIKIQRAVIHPTRNQPLVKVPKTKTSNRIIPYFEPLKALIEQDRTKGYSGFGQGSERRIAPYVLRSAQGIRKDPDVF